MEKDASFNSRLEFIVDSQKDISIEEAEKICESLIPSCLGLAYGTPVNKNLETRTCRGILIETDPRISISRIALLFAYIGKRIAYAEQMRIIDNIGKS